MTRTVWNRLWCRPSPLRGERRGASLGHVSTAQDSPQRRQGASGLVGRREPARPGWAGSSATGALSREINDSQRAAWSRAIEVFDEGGQSTQIALFPEDRVAPVLDCDVVSIRLSQMRLRRPRQWGACWLAMVLWDQLRLDDFWGPALPPSREGTDWLNVLKTLVAYQLISPGSEWRLHRHWFEH